MSHQTNDIAHILDAISRSESFDELPVKIAEACAEGFGAEFCTLWRMQPGQDGREVLRLAGASAGLRASDSAILSAVYGLSKDVTGMDSDGLTGFIADTRQAVKVNSYAELTDRFAHVLKGRLLKSHFGEKLREDFRNLCGVPLVCGSKLLGVLRLENLSRPEVTDDDVTLLETLAQFAGVAIHSLQLYDQHRQRSMDAILDLSNTLLQPFEQQVVMQRIVDTTADILDAQICSLWLIEPDGRTLAQKANKGYLGDVHELHTYDLPWDTERDEDIKGLTAWVAVRDRECEFNSHQKLREHPSWRGEWDDEQWGGKPEEQFGCLFAVPLRAMGKVRGVLKVENKKNAARFSVSDMETCRLMASYLVLALELGHTLRTGVLADMAHIIRSPIGQTAMNLDALDHQLRSGKPDLSICRTYVDILKRAMLSISGTARNLTALVALQQGLQTRENREWILLPELLDGQIKSVEVLESATRRFRRSGFAPWRVSLTFYEHTMFEIAVYNVLHNAVKFSPDGEDIEVKIEESDEGALNVSIGDQGVGIAPGDQSRVFAPAFRRRAPGWSEGTGMGLAAVAEVVKQLGWEKQLKSSPGAGTQITFVIPETRVRHVD